MVFDVGGEVTSKVHVSLSRYFKYLIDDNFLSRSRYISDKLKYKVQCQRTATLIKLVIQSEQNRLKTATEIVFAE